MHDDNKFQMEREQIEELHGPTHDHYRPPRVHLPTLTDQAIANLSETELVKEATLFDEVMVELARRDPNAFIEYVFEDVNGNPLRQTWFQEEWQKAMGAHDRTLIAAPRDHGKTTQVIGRALFELGQNPDLRTKIVCASDSKATERLFEIKQHLERNDRLRKVFPHLVPADKGRWTQHKIITKRSSISRDASVEAMGITSSATGGRADLLIADDVVDRRNALQMPALRQSVKTAWFADWTQLLEPAGRIIYICTFWTLNDLSWELKDNPVYHVVSHSVGEGLQAIWPEVWNHERLKQRRNEIGPTEFARAYRNLPRDTSESPVQPQWINYASTKNLLMQDVVFVQSYDLSTGEGSGSDYFASVIFAVHTKQRKAYVIDAWHARLSFPEQVEAIKEEAAKYRGEIVIEATSYQYSLIQYFHEQEPWLTIFPFKPRVNKHLRLDNVTPHMARGQVVFRDGLEPGQLAQPERGDLVSELLDFPLGKFDDLADAYVQGVLHIRERFLPDPAAQERTPEVTVTILGGDPERRPKYYKFGPGEDEGEGEIYYTKGGRPRRRPPSNRPARVPNAVPATEPAGEIVLPPGIKRLQ